MPFSITQLPSADKLCQRLIVADLGTDFIPASASSTSPRAVVARSRGCAS